MAHKSIYVKLSETVTLLVTGEYTPAEDGVPESFELEHAFHLDRDVNELLDARGLVAHAG